METAIVHETFVVALGHDEACAVLAGKTVVDRNSPLDPMAKVIVRPLVDFDPIYKPVEVFRSRAYLDRLRTVRCVATMAGDSDVTVYVPEEVVRDSFLAAEHIPRDEVDVVNSDYPNGLRQTLPVNGITIRFDSGVGDREFYNLHHPV
ncbi:MAG TPA: hypothetical protein VK712_03665 [Verrucomicrobiae bacterium]|jgi:hypothetical protein|nr:hypothetical protein [Verrucomicrobiae bacterium]